MKAKKPDGIELDKLANIGKYPFDINDIKTHYTQSKGWREFGKWIFALATGGLGALYLWATTVIIKEGYIGLRRSARGELILLPPGRHSIFPWESYPSMPQSLGEDIITLGPYKIITVETGFVAKTRNAGNIEILLPGQHLLTKANHIFQEFISTKQETKKLTAVQAFTGDNVGLTIHADVRYVIEDPILAVQTVDEIENSIKEISQIQISRIVGLHTLADFAPATSGAGNQPHHGMGEVIKELTKNITEQLLALGIKLLSIGITSWIINDESLAHALAQGAVIQSQAQSKVISAEREAKVKAIEALADAQATATRANGEAEAIRIKGAAFGELGKSFQGNPGALQMYQREQNTALVKNASSPHLFFTPQPIPTQLQLNTSVIPTATDVSQVEHVDQPH